MPPPIPTVSITVLDNPSGAAVTVPLSTTQLKVGVSIGGTVNVPIATMDPAALQANLIGGPLVESGGLVCLAGNLVVAVPIPIVTHGTATAVVATTTVGGSTSVITTTLDSTHGAWDAYFIKIVPVVSGTIGTAGIIIKISADAGRTYGPPISLGTATALYLGAGSLTSFLPGGTGIQLNFAAGTIQVGDSWTFSTTAPAGNSAGILAALLAFQGSQYGLSGVGSIHVVGDTMHGGSTDIDIAGIQTQLQFGVSVYKFQRAIVELRDVLTPVVWGGAGETEAVWIGVLQTAVSGLVSHPRVCADGGNYNMQTAYSNADFGTPQYRRSGAWAHAVIRTQIGLQQRSGRILNANQPYSQINVNPATDPSDGFVYHDERMTPGLAASRISCMMTWPGKGKGFFHSTEPLLCAPGSQISELVIGNVVDVACDIGYQEGVEQVSDDLLTQANGTLDPSEVQIINGGLQGALNVGMIQTSLVSGVTAKVSTTANVQQTGQVPISIVVSRKGYVDAIAETISVAVGGG